MCQCSDNCTWLIISINKPESTILISYVVYFLSIVSCQENIWFIDTNTETQGTTVDVSKTMKKKCTAAVISPENVISIVVYLCKVLLLYLV